MCLYEVGKYAKICLMDIFSEALYSAPSSSSHKLVKKEDGKDLSSCRYNNADICNSKFSDMIKGRFIGLVIRKLRDLSFPSLASVLQEWEKLTNASYFKDEVGMSSSQKRDLFQFGASEEFVHTGLPAIIARNMMQSARLDSTFLPSVARSVRNSKSAQSASATDGADFMRLVIENKEDADILVHSVCQVITILVFVMLDSIKSSIVVGLISELKKIGASGLVISAANVEYFGDDIL